MRWPLLLAILLPVIAAVYRYGPNVRHTWRQCLPGAALAVLLWVGAAALFRATQGSDGTDGPGWTRATKGSRIVPGLHTLSSEMRRATERRRCGATASKAS